MRVLQETVARQRRDRTAPHDYVLCCGSGKILIIIKKVFPDWKNLIKHGNEEKDHWVPDEASTKCTTCKTYFGAFVRRHHCRNCGDIFCDKCTQGRIVLTTEENAQQVRVCDQCMAEVTQRLSHVNEVADRGSFGFNRHEDLTKFY
uniref:FYVE-type domain-containing protein n=1 Tax=Lactuca sativa TaxID=4236 RepID=A0A9R1VHF3_LACSA|nr:hypothetical protein LSAT_V11C500252380 [Lactuca sativa]